MKNNYREQVQVVSAWFKEWSECEQTVALYSLLKKSSPIQARFLDQVLQQSLADCSDVQQWEAKANDEGYVRSLYTEEKAVVIHQLLNLLPLLQAGKNSAKAAYLALIPDLLSHTIHNGVNIEESRQLLSYSLIHPAITTEERGTFQHWLGCLDERFTYSSSTGSSNSPVSSTTNSVSSSSSLGQVSGMSTLSHSPSPAGSSSQHSLSQLPSVELSVSSTSISQAQQQQTQNSGHSGHSSPSPVIGSGAHPSWQQQQGQGHFTSGNLDASAAINPTPAPPSGETSGCAQYISHNSQNNGHGALRSTNSHVGAFGPRMDALHHGHAPLHPTLSAPSNMNTMNAINNIPPPTQQPQQQQAVSQQAPPTKPSSSSHAPLRRTQSIVPPQSAPRHATDNTPQSRHVTDSNVMDWLQTNHHHQLTAVTSSPAQLSGRHAHLMLGGRYPEHAPLSPQSSTSSSGSGGSEDRGGEVRGGEDGSVTVRDSFMEEGSGMREVPVWLKTLRLHKYSHLFSQMTYEDMLSVTEAWLEGQNVTKGARHKIYVSICKLRERQELLRNLEKSICHEGGSINNALSKMKEMLNTPIKAFNPTQCSLTSANPAYRSINSTPSTPATPTPQSPSADEVMEGDLPAQFCRLMGKVCTQLLVVSRPEDEFKVYLQLIDKCLNHEAFSDGQKKRLLSWKQSAQKIWHPSPHRYGDRPRKSFGSTFHNQSLGGRIIPRSGRGPLPQGPLCQHPTLSQQWSFGSKRSILGSAAHTVVSRNNSLNTTYLNKPGLMEQTKQAVSRVHSAPTHRPISLTIQGCENANDKEINARLDSLCISMTEHALGSSDQGQKF